MPTISGITYDSSNTPAQKFVTVQKRSTLEYIERINSDAVTGAYSVTTPDYSECVVTAYDEALVGYVDTTSEYTSLLLHFDGGSGSTSYVDSGPLGISVSRETGTGTQSTAQIKSGVSSGYFDGTTRLRLGSNSALNLSGMFTIEMWVFFLNSSDCHLMYGPGNYQVRRIASDRLSMYPLFNGTAANTITSNVWHHLAWTRDSSNIVRTFLDGVVQGVSSATSTTFVLSAGAIGEGNSGFTNGYIDELRIKKGVCLYASAFTPPASFLGGGLEDGGSSANARIFDRVIPV